MVKKKRDEYINFLLIYIYIHTYTYVHIYHSTLIKKAILQFTTTQMDLEGIMLSKENQTEKD